MQYLEINNIQIEDVQIKNRAFRSAYIKGAKCAIRNGSLEENPYGDARTYYGGVTFARAFWKCWNRGFERMTTAMGGAND